MSYLLRSMLGLAAIAISSLAHGAVISNLEDATNGGGFFGEVTFENNGANTVMVTADISAPINVGLTQGDILGLWFDLGNFGSLTGGPTFGGSTSVLDFEFSENSVGTSLGGNTNINGSGASNWDLAVEVGENGSDGGFVQTLSFDITITGLNETLFEDQRVGMRVQSIEGGTFLEGSSKLLIVPEPGVLALFGLGLLGLGFVRRRAKM